MFLKTRTLLFAILFHENLIRLRGTILFISIFYVGIASGQKRGTIITPNPTLPTASGPAIPNPQHDLLPSAQEIQQQNLRIVERDMLNNQIEEQRRKDLVHDAYKELGLDENGNGTGSIISKINHSFPFNTSNGKKHFDNAFQEISEMIDGKRPYNLKRAVFLTEHAYDTTLNFDQFQRQIAKLVAVIQLEMKQKKISSDDNLGKIMTAFKFMADTIKVRNSITEKFITTYPKTYDFEDFYGMSDYRKMFVSNLIRTGRGQCHSLPLLFLILCQEINAKAYLSFSPEHSYVKFLDKMGSLQNIELTNQMFTTDQFILQSGYVTSAAIKSRIYMDTLGLRRVVAYTLNDLVNCYVRKYRYDDFALRGAEKLLSVEPNSVHATMHKANYYNYLGHNIERQYQNLRVPREYYFTQDEVFRSVIRNAINYGQLLDNLGYAEMPPEMYANWLSSLKNESLKQQHIERKRILSSMIEH